jgi:phosphate:Na+ symporter
MNTVVPLLIAAVGLCFFGLDLISHGLQESTSRTLRALIRRSTKSHVSCALVGFGAGAIIQSTSAVTVVLGSMAATGMVTLQQALPIVAFANVGTTILVFVTALDIHLAVLVAVGLGGIAFSMTTQFRWRAGLSVGLGVALLLYSSDLMTTAASGLERANWFSNFLRAWSGSTLMTFALGALASFLTQSTTAVAVMAVALATTALVDPPEAIMMIYGANLGSTLMRMLLTRGCTGTLRQVSRFQDLFKIAGTSAFVALFYVEHAAGVPLVAALVSRISSQLPFQLAAVNLLLNGSMAALVVLFAAPIQRLVERTWPSSEVEQLSVPQYVSLDATGDAETAIDLLEREQMRVLKNTRRYLTLVRPESPDLSDFDAGGLRRSFLALFREIDQFHIALVGQHVDATTSARLANVHDRQKLLELVEDSLFQLTATLTDATHSPKLEPLVITIVDALDFLLMFSGDAARTLDRGRAELVYGLTADRGEMMAGIRGMHFAPEHGLTSVERALLLRVTHLFERIVWMLQRYAELLVQTVEAGSDEREARPSAVEIQAQQLT